MLNLIVVVVEDDRQGVANFFLDLPHMVQMSNHARLRCHLLYHSLHNHGDYTFLIEHGSVNVRPVGPLNMNPEYFLHSVARFLKTSYDAKATNAFVFSGHCSHVFVRPFRRNLHPWMLVNLMEQQRMRFKFILMDCCNTACVETVYLYRNVTDFLVGCQSQAPMIGFLGPDFARILASRSPWPEKLRQLCDAFLARVNSHKSLHYTDCAVITTKYAQEIPELFSHAFYRNQRARTTPSKEERTVFDIVALMRWQKHLSADQRQKMAEWVHRSVLYYQQCNQLRRKAWAHKLHGISVVLNRDKEVKHF